MILMESFFPEYIALLNNTFCAFEKAAENQTETTQKI